MGSLSNLYISNSFQSLIHLGSDGTASATSTQLEDGLGNGIGVYVNTSGHVSASAFSGSLNGIGNVTLFSTSVDSRLDVVEATASLYIPFSTSVDSRLDTLEAFSSSADSRYVRNSQTSSMAVSSSTYAVTASYALNAQTASEARNLVVIARNGNQSTLSAGTVVHITGASGDNPIFNTASFDSEALSSNTLGIIRTTTTSGADCEVVVNGIVLGVNTDPALGYAAGDIIYLSSSGQFTKVQPQAPQQIVTLGQVLRAQQNNGSIYVNVSNGWELDELHNVQINTPLTNDLLAYESSSYGLWKNKSFSSLGLATTSSVNSISTSVGLLQTFSSSQYKNDSSSFDSRISALAVSGNVLIVQDEGTILGPATSMNFIGAGVSATISAGTASVTVSGINTASFATTGSNSFVGNQIITGSVIMSSSAAVELQVIGAMELTGSVAGNITALSVASSTASIDFNLGSFFTLTIPSSSITYITGSNLKPGMTANLILTQQATTGSVRFETSLFKFPSGSINTGSAVASAVDMVSMASVNGTTLYSVTARQLQ